MTTRKKKKPTFPQPEHNTLIQLLKKSDRLLENEMKGQLAQEKAAYNRDVRSRSSMRKSTAPISPQQMAMETIGLPPIEVQLSSSPDEFFSVEALHMSAFTPRLSTRPKTAPRNSVLGKDGVNYSAYSYSSYQRMANQYSQRKGYVSPSNQYGAIPVDSPQNEPTLRPMTVGGTTPHRPFRLQAELSAENIQVLPSSSVQNLLASIEAPNITPLIPPPTAAEIIRSYAPPLVVQHSSPPVDEKKSYRRTSKRATLKLPVQQVNIHVNGTTPRKRDSLTGAPPSPRAKQFRNPTVLSNLASTTVDFSAPSSPSAILLHSPDGKPSAIENQDLLMDSPLDTSHAMSSRAILRTYQHMASSGDFEVTDELSFSQFDAP